MHGFLRSHAAMVIPLMTAGNLAWARSAGITWPEARQHAEAAREAYAMVRALGHRLSPGFIAVLSQLPVLLTTTLMWLASRTAVVRDLGSFGPGEVRMLIDAMLAAAPPGASTRALARIRPG